MSGYSATKAAQVGFAESLRTEFAGTPIHVSVVFPISTETEFRDAMERDYGHSVGGLGPKQSVEDVARAIVGLHPEAAPRGLSARGVARAGDPERRGAGLHRSARRQVRPPPRDSIAMPGAFVDIPGGSFSMGSHDGQDDEAPVHVVHVDAFAIAACPVTREEYERFIVVTGHPAPREWLSPEFDRPGLPGGRRELGRRGGLLRVARRCAAADRSGVGTGRPRRPRGGTISVGRPDPVVDP